MVLSIDLYLACINSLCTLSCLTVYNQGAMEKSARAAGVHLGTAEKYASEVLRKMPGNSG